MATYIAGISDFQRDGRGAAVYIDSEWQAGHGHFLAPLQTGHRRHGRASEAILSMRPVTFHYKPELDAGGLAQFGLIAEEVAAVNPDLVVRDAEGEIFTVRYEAVNAMLLNEFLKEHKKIETQEEAIAQQQRRKSITQSQHERAGGIHPGIKSAADCGPGRPAVTFSSFRRPQLRLFR